MEKIWTARELPDELARKELQDSLQVDELTARLLVQRGVTSFESAKKFFRPDLNDLHDPFLMKDMEAAANRVLQAIDGHENILVYGDYDVDGTTAVTLMYSALTQLGANCQYYIPDRYKEGYGFSFAGVDFAAANQCSLIITLDCGVRDGEKVAYARSLGIDVVICDHHQPEDLPEAIAVLDPKRPDCSYPFDGLSGCGVGYKLLQAIIRKQGRDEAVLNTYLDLLTISIGADIVPLTGENRILAYHGLNRLEQFRRPGIAAMLTLAGFRKETLSITDVVFILAPRINAAGRIYSGSQAVALLLSENEEETLALSRAVEENNKTRKNLDKEITAEALAKLTGDDFYRDSFSSVVSGETWHKGVVGIVASRLVEAHYKPAIVMVTDGEKMSGSARSIEGVDLFEVLGECSDLLLQFGGHTMAAGLSLKSENFLLFREKFDLVVRQALDNQRPIPELFYDCEINLDDITPQFYRRMIQFAPFGPGNMKPVFLVKNLKNTKYSRAVGDGGLHLKLHVHQLHQPEKSIEGIGFDLGNYATDLASGATIDVLCTLEENVWNDRISLQLQIKDIRITA
jgi:single-stranded-DNA-specific exonuclease